MKTLDPTYRCECNAAPEGTRCDDPPLGTPDAELRAFYARHPFRALTGQSPRSRADDARADRRRRAGGR